MPSAEEIELRLGPKGDHKQRLVESGTRFVVHFRVRMPGPSAAKAALRLPLAFGKRIRPQRIPLPGGFGLFEVRMDQGKVAGYDDIESIRDATMNFVRSRIGRQNEIAACYHTYARPANSQGGDDPDSELFPSGKLFLEFHESVPEPLRRQILDHYFLMVERAVPYWPGAYVVHVTQQTGTSPVRLAQELQSLKFKRKGDESPQYLLSWADPLFHRRRKFLSIPADGLFKFQWHLHNDGSQGGIPGADIRAPEAWDITRGDPSVRVAIIDDAFELNHPEIGAAGRLVAPLDANTNEPDVAPVRGADQWHGTSVMGLLAAAHNGRGTCGVAPGCEIIPIKLDALSDDEAEARAFDHAVEHGAHVINCSWGPYDDYSRDPWPLPRLVDLALQNAFANHVAVVFAAGNGNESIQRDGYASCPHVITVSASTDGNRRAYFSDYGEEVWVCAPSSGGARGIVTTDVAEGGYSPLGGYSDGFGGTSAAAPLVSGVIALMQSAYLQKYRAGRLTVPQIKNILKQTARKIDREGEDFLEYWEKQPVSVKYDPNTGHSLAYGYGLVDAGRALRAVCKLPSQVNEPVVPPRWDGEGELPSSVVPFDGLTTPLRPRTVGDPLSLFHTELPRHISKDRFESGEHVWLASRGFERALTENPDFEKAGLSLKKLRVLRREDEEEGFSYGEIVALSGDFYASPGDLYWEKKSFLSFLWEKNDLSDIREGFAKELQAIRAQQMGKIAYPDNNIAYWWNAKQYVELAKDNAIHFGWHNLMAYCRYHTQAIELADMAFRYRRNEPVKEAENWRKALFVNAFADHFLTDGFAAGHLRVPRQEILDWALEKGFTATVAGVLSKLLHDQDGHHAGRSHEASHTDADVSADGLPVLNSRGDAWSARCDGQLFIGTSEADPAVRWPVEAVKASVTELCRVYAFGHKPEGRYTATDFVPFPDPKGPKLVDKFPANIDDTTLDEIFRRIAWYFKLPFFRGSRIEKTQIRALFEALPTLMTRFRAAVLADVKRYPEWTARLPKPLIQGFSNAE